MQVKGVYESEGTSAAELLMGEGMPEVVRRAFEMAGWGAELDKATRRGGARGGGGGMEGEGVANAALDEGRDFSDEEEEEEEGVGVGEGEERGRVGEGGRKARLAEAGAASKACSASSSSMPPRRKRGREEGAAKAGGERGSSRSASKDGTKDAEASKTMPRGAWCRREGVKGKYYSTQGKYLCNNCGRSGHVRSTCDMPDKVLDTALETLGWQVTVVQRKGGASEEKFFVSPDREHQVRGLSKLLAFLLAGGMGLDKVYSEAGRLGRGEAGRGKRGGAGGGGGTRIRSRIGSL